MSKRQARWGLAVAPMQRIIHSLEFDNAKEARERARQENRYGEYRGRGVKAVRLDRGDYAPCNCGTWDDALPGGAQGASPPECPKHGN